MGLLFGSYTSASEFTCQWRQGSYDKEQEDARNLCEQARTKRAFFSLSLLAWPDK
jgi:hypothetical protein